jgi:hypothetical protein
MNRKLQIGISLMIALAFMLPATVMASPDSSGEGLEADEMKQQLSAEETTETLGERIAINGQVNEQGPGDTLADLYVENPDGEFMLLENNDIILEEDFYNFWAKITPVAEMPYHIEPELELYQGDCNDYVTIYETGFEDNARNYMEWGQIDNDCDLTGGYYDGWSWSDSRACEGEHSFKNTMYDEYKNEQDDDLYMKELIDVSGNEMVKFCFDIWVQGEHQWFWDQYTPLDYVQFGIIDGGTWIPVDNGDGQAFVNTAGAPLVGNYYFFDTSIALSLYTDYSPHQDYTNKAEKIDGCPGWWRVCYEMPVDDLSDAENVGMWFNWQSDKERVFEGAYVDNVNIQVYEKQYEKIYQGHSQEWIEITEDKLNELGDYWFKFPLTWDDVVSTFDFECGSDLNCQNYKAILKIKNNEDIGDPIYDNPPADLELNLYDSFGDGWSYPSWVDVYVDGDLVLEGATLSTGNNAYFTIPDVPHGSVVEVCYTGGVIYESEQAWYLYQDGDLILSDGDGYSAPTEGCMDVTIITDEILIGYTNGYDLEKEIKFEVGEVKEHIITDLTLHDEFSGEIITDMAEQGSSIHVNWCTENIGNTEDDITIKATAYESKTETLFEEDFEGMFPQMLGYGGNARLPYKSDKFAFSGSNSMAFNDPDTLHYGEYDYIGSVFSEAIDMEGVTEAWLDHYYMGKLGSGDDFRFLVGTPYSAYIYTAAILIDGDEKVEPWIGPMQPQCSYSQINIKGLFDVLESMKATLDENGNPTYDMWISYLLVSNGDDKFYYGDEFDWSGAYVDDITITSKVRGEAVWTDQTMVPGCDIGDTCCDQFLWENVPFSCYELVVETVLPEPFHNHEMSQEFCVLDEIKKMAKADGVDYTECESDAWCISAVVGNDNDDQYALATNCDTNEIPVDANSYVGLGPGDDCMGIDVSRFTFVDPPEYFFDFEGDDGGWEATATWDPVGDWEYTPNYDIGDYDDSQSTYDQDPPNAAISGTGLWGTKVFEAYSNSGGESFLSQTFDFSGFSAPEMRFWSWEDVFGSFDYGQVTVNGDLVWGPSWDYSDISWEERVIDLSAYAGMSDVEIVFEMHASTVVNYAGWYIDDIWIGDPVLSGVSRGRQYNCSEVLFQDFDEDTAWGDQFGTPPFMPIQGEGTSVPFGVAWDTAHPDGYFWQDGEKAGYGYPHDDGGYAYSYTNADSMIAPTVQLKNGTAFDDHVLTFWYAAENAVYPQSLEVYVNGNLEWSDTDFTHIADDTEPENGYIEATVYLDAYADQPVEIEFVNAGTTNLYGMFVDDVVLVSCEEEPGPGPEPEPEQDPLLLDLLYQVDIYPAGGVHLEIATGVEGMVDGVCEGCDDTGCLCPPGINAWSTIQTFTGNTPGVTYNYTVDLSEYIPANTTWICLRLRLETPDFWIPGIGFHLHEYTLNDILYDELTGEVSDYHVDFEDGMMEHTPGCVTFGEYWEQNETNYNRFEQEIPGEPVDNALVWTTSIDVAYAAWLYADWEYSIGPDCELTLEMSADGGDNWFIIAREFGADASALGPIPCTPFDLTPWAGQTLMFRVHVNNEGGHSGFVAVEDFLIMGKIDTTAPTASISLSGSLVGPNTYDGPVTATITATDDTGMGEICYIHKNEGQVVKETCVEGDSVSVTVSTDGENSIEFWAVDAAGNVGPHSTVSFFVDSTPPTVSLDAPEGGLYLFGNKLLSMNKPFIIGGFTAEATASDAQGVQLVEFLLDGTLIGADTEAPYSMYISVKNMGGATLSARAVDSVGNVDEDSMDITYYKFL